MEKLANQPSWVLTLSLTPVGINSRGILKAVMNYVMRPRQGQCVPCHVGSFSMHEPCSTASNQLTPPFLLLSTIIEFQAAVDRIDLRVSGPNQLVNAHIFNRHCCVDLAAVILTCTGSESFISGDSLRRARKAYCLAPKALIRGNFLVATNQVSY